MADLHYDRAENVVFYSDDQTVKPITLEWKEKSKGEAAIPSLGKPTEKVRKIRTAPNPFSEQLTIEIEASREQEANLLLLDLNGQIQKSKLLQLQAGANRIQWHGLSDLPAGSYFYQLRLADDILSGRLLKAR